jgi:hypothetical protein
MPSLYQFSWRVDFEEFSLKRIGKAPRNARGTPLPADPNVGGPFPCVEHARIDPPVDDLWRGQGQKDPLWRRSEFDAGDNASVN